jgi:PEGA domain
MSSVTASVKVTVNPSRATVLMDGVFVGNVGEFEGLGRSMLVAPGAHKIKIALPGYQTFETDINVIANQKLEIKTDLAKSDSSTSNSNTGVAPQPGKRSPTSIPPPPPQQH